MKQSEISLCLARLLPCGKIHTEEYVSVASLYTRYEKISLAKNKVKSVLSVGTSCKQADFLYFATANICRRAAGNARVW